MLFELSFKKWAKSWPLFNLFSVFSNDTILTTNNVKNVMSIQYTVRGFKPMAPQTLVVSHNHLTRATAQYLFT